MKAMLLLITLLLSVAIEGWAQQPAPSPNKIINATPCVPRQSPKRTPRPLAQTSGPAPVEPAAEFFVGEAMVEVTKDQTVVRLAMAGCLRQSRQSRSVRLMGLAWMGSPRR